MRPAAGFTGGLVVENETLCFYDSTIWIPSLLPPAGCTDVPVNLAPWSLTFGGVAIGGGSRSQVATLANVGAGAVTIAAIVSSGDFTQSNDCPTSLAAGGSCSIAVIFTPTAAGIRSGSVSILDKLESSPQVLNLAGLGLPAQ